MIPPESEPLFEHDMDASPLRGYERLNPYFKISMETARNVSLHVEEMKLSPGDQFFYFQDALQRLARMLESDERLSKVEKITVTSWFVAIQPSFFKRCDFIVDTSDSDELGQMLKQKYIDNLNILERNSESSLPDPTIKPDIPPQYMNTLPGYAYMERDVFIKKYRGDNI